MRSLSLPQRAVLVAAATLFTCAGIGHFLVPTPLMRMIPPYLPAHLALVWISGIFELAGGLALMFTRTRRAAAWVLMGLLIAILPANLYMIAHPAEAGVGALPPTLLWMRVLFLPAFLWTLSWCSGLRRGASRA